MSFQHLLASIVGGEKSAFSCIFVPLCVMGHFSLVAFKSLFLSLASGGLTMLLSGCGFLTVYLTWIW